MLQKCEKINDIDCSHKIFLRRKMQSLEDNRVGVNGQIWGQRKILEMIHALRYL